MYKEILSARKNIEKYIKKTDTIYAEKLSSILKSEVYLKLENLQKSGSFKVRGAINKILSMNEQERKRGIIAASAGNHAQGVAIAAQLVNVKATIFMPIHAPKAKIKATRDFGAKVILHGQTFDQAMKYARNLQKELNAAFVHPFDDDKIIAGQGTIGLEIIETIKDVDQIIVPIGGGGLIAGISSAIKHINPKIKIIGVQTDKVRPMFESLINKKLKNVKAKTTIADGIAVGSPAEKTFNIIKNNVEKIITVSDEEISRSILFLLESCKIVTEGAGAASVAALFSNQVDLKNKKTVSIISGGNVDVTTLESIINKALLSEKRRAEIKLNLDDSPHNLVKILSIIANNDGNIHNIKQGNSRKNLEINKQGLTVVFDTSGKETTDKIINEIKRKGYKII